MLPPPTAAAGRAGRGAAGRRAAATRLPAPAAAGRLPARRPSAAATASRRACRSLIACARSLCRPPSICWRAFTAAWMSALCCVVSATSVYGLLLVHLQLRLPHLDLVLGLLHLRQQLALGVRHPLHVLDAVQQVGERARPQHLEHVGAVALVGRDEERGQVLLGDPQVGLGQLQPAGVLADVRLHLRQLRLGPVLRLDGGVELLVERVQLVLDLGDLRPRSG